MCMGEWTSTLDFPSVCPLLRDFLRGGPKKLLIHGRWVPSKSERTFSTLDPATGEPLATLYEADEADVDEAVRSARKALEGSWSRISPAEEGPASRKLADLIEENAEEL